MRGKKKKRGTVAREADGADDVLGWLVVGDCLAAAVVVVGGSGGGGGGDGGGGGGGGGGCSGFRECPRKTSAVSHHGEPTEIQ